MIIDAADPAQSHGTSTRNLASNGWFYYSASYCWLWAGWFLARLTDNGQLWVLLAGSIILGLPVFVSRLYLSTLNKTFRNHQFRNKSFLRAFWSGRLLAAIFWLLISLLSGVLLLYWFRSLTLPEWSVLCVGVPTLRFLFLRTAVAARSQYQEYLAFAKGLSFAQTLCTPIIAAIWVVINFSLLQVADAPLLSEVMSEQREILLSPDHSVVVQILNRYSIYYKAVSTLGMELLKAETAVAYPMAIAIFTLAALLSLTVAISAFLIPARESQRILAPLTEEPVVPALTLERSSIMTAVAVIILLFVYIPVIASLEQFLKESVRDGQVGRFELALLPHVEEIEGRFFKAGTSEKLALMRARLFKEQLVDKQELERQLDAAYAAMGNNVDSYLDEYYRLSAEYVRIAAMITSDFEAQIHRKLIEELGKDQPFAEFEKTTRELERFLEQFEAEKEQLLRENEVLPPVGNFWALEKISQVLLLPPEVLSVSERAAGSAGVGAVSSLVASKIAAKVAAKGTLKLATKAVAKAAISKAGAAGTSTIGGALIGSVIPGVGTAIGATLGFGVGLVFGISVDAAMLKFEETLKREEFKLQILDALSATKAEHKQLLRL